MVEAVQLFIEATQYELALRTYAILNNIFEHENNYKDMITNLENHDKFCSELVREDYTPQRIVQNFYRIGFYGEGWGAKDGLQYIYKRATRLSNIKDELQDIHKHEFGDKLEMLLVNDPIDKSKLNKDKVYIQIAGVKPYIPPEESDRRLAEFENNFNINKFVFERIQKVENKKVAENDVEHQTKKKNYIYNEASIPKYQNSNKSYR